MFCMIYFSIAISQSMSELMALNDLSHSITHYNDVIMSMMAFQITSLTIVYSTAHSGVGQIKHQSSASLAFVRGIHQWPVNSPRKGPVMRKTFPFDDVIMIGLKPGVGDSCGFMASHLTNNWTVCSKTCSGLQQWKLQSSALLAFYGESTEWESTYNSTVCSTACLG